ncbi:hypothetical protein EJ02DRAFT_444783 [Clathrospora elynae]|uniref:Tc1-like transposase DDE domain-containing protein n=1 Tax=Clathrospora elynae TaxID=706981 RepID=A0A6A5SPA5_9PLEO|nr:hypothetical protein EJ02DRAFT_444783 [Clathrospora elynae]
MPKERKTHICTTYNQVTEVKALHQRGRHLQQKIAELLGLTERQISLAIKAEHVTAKKCKEYPCHLTDAQVNELVEYARRKIGEEIYDTGIMFWDCFSYNKKGPCLFWEKEWVSINKESYCKRIVSLVQGWLTPKAQGDDNFNSIILKLMHDNAPGHTAAYTVEELAVRDVHPIFWPDLNPIEPARNGIKDYTGRYYPDLDAGKQYSHDELYMIVKEAWDYIIPKTLKDLVDSMPARCQAVIDV